MRNECPNPQAKSSETNERGRYAPVPIWSNLRLSLERETCKHQLVCQMAHLRCIRQKRVREEPCIETVDKRTSHQHPSIMKANVQSHRRAVLAGPQTLENPDNAEIQ